jgi:hypothetical protein
MTMIDVSISILASDIAMVRWPDDTPEHQMARDAFMEGTRIVASAVRGASTKHTDDTTRLDFLGGIAKQSGTGASIDYGPGGMHIMWHHHIGKYFSNIRDAIDDAAKEFATEEKGTCKS